MKLLQNQERGKGITTIFINFIFFQDVFDGNYKRASEDDKGTLGQLAVRFDRKNVRAVAKKAYDANRKFLHFVTEGYLVLLAMKKLNLEDKDDEPSTNLPDDRKRYFDSFVMEILDEHIYSYQTPQQILGKVTPSIPMQPPLNQALSDHQYVQHNTKLQTYFCPYPLCDASFNSITIKTRHEEKCIFKNSDRYSQTQLELRAEEIKLPKEEDHKYNYVTRLLRYGLSDMASLDATREGDGLRLCAHWKQDFLLFKSGGHTNYSILAFTLVAQKEALLSENEADQMLHNRFVNVHGGEGRNVSSDLALEHLNKEVKPSVSKKTQITSKVLERAGRSVKVVSNVVNTFDSIIQFYSSVGRHKPTNYDKEIGQMCKELKNENLFSVIPGRHFNHFPSVERFPEHQIDGRSLRQWIVMQKIKLSQSMAARRGCLNL